MGKQAQKNPISLFASKNTIFLLNLTREKKNSGHPCFTLMKTVKP